MNDTTFWNSDNLLSYEQNRKINSVFLLTNSDGGAKILSDLGAALALLSSALRFSQNKTKEDQGAVIKSRRKISCILNAISSLPSLQSLIFSPWGPLKKERMQGEMTNAQTFLGMDAMTIWDAAAIVCNYGLISSYCSPSMEKRHESFVLSNEW